MTTSPDVPRWRRVARAVRGGIRPRRLLSSAARKVEGGALARGVDLHPPHRRPLEARWAKGMSRPPGSAPGHPEVEHDAVHGAPGLGIVE